MKKWLFAILCFTVFFTLKDVHAFNADNYKYRDLCGNYEVAGFHSDGYIATIGCFEHFNDAQRLMRENGADDLVVMGYSNDGVKVLDANMALVDLTVNPNQLTYYYENSELTSRQYTYTANGPYYGDVDGGFIQPAYSTAKQRWVAKVRLANFTGWIPEEAYELVPITWLKSYSCYIVTDEYIKHNYVTKIQNDHQLSGSSIIGPKPDMLNPGMYYSYDGHYFYKSIRDLMKDYRNNTYDNAINKNNVYYNYYMYLSNHTRTTYSSVNIDEYIRNNLGFDHDIYGDDTSDKGSRLYGTGTFFYYAQEKYGVNAVMSLGLSKNETGNGRSYLAIMKNNGFGLNAVDSDPINGASWYATYADSILGYASHWATYGFNHPRDWRYFGPQFGDKWVGMNVKYASAAYWSEAMAANYYFLDRAFGLQDYNYYQLGVIKYTTNAYSEPSTSSKFMYEYPEAEDAVVIIGEETRNGEKWYKLQSDLNFDSNYNEIYEAGNYNWNAAVYVKADAIKKINNGKNGYVSPNSVTEYQNKNYDYNLYSDNGVFKPRVGLSTKDTYYYYDSSLTSKTGQKLLKDRYVIIYAQANVNNTPVAYLVSNNFYLSQRQWVSADSIKQTNTAYGKVNVRTETNDVAKIHSTTENTNSTAISGIHTMSYVPIVDTVEVNGKTWYKVPVNLSGYDNLYGYILSRDGDYSWIDYLTPIAEDASPTINASNKELYEGDSFDPLEGVTATDPEDGDLTSSIQITKNTVNTETVGTYEVTYEVKDSSNRKAIKTITVTVKENKAPVIEASDKTITINTSFDPKQDVTATDPEDGELTSSIQVTSNDVDITTIGTYHVTYKVTDSKERSTTKTITVEVVADREPVINAQDIQILLDSEYNPLEGVTATDPEDGDLTDSISVTKNTVDPSTIGTYEVKYQVTDSSDNTVTKTIAVAVVNYQEREGEFYLKGLTWNKDTNKFTISGFIKILGVNNIDKTYELLLINKNTNAETTKSISKWEENIPYNLGIEDGHDYNDSWFKSELDLSTLSNGDYDLYIITYSKEYTSKVVLNNLFNTNIDRRGQAQDKGYSFKVQQKTKNKEIELEVRDEIITIGSTPTNRNMANGYDDVSIVDNQLHILGYSYDIGAYYDKNESVIHKIILENQSTFERKIYETTNSEGPFLIETLDGKNKKYAWFENNIDLSELSTGKYTIYIYTKTSNSENYDELPDAFKFINIHKEIGNKIYTIKYNQSRLNRIEITVE